MTKLSNKRLKFITKQVSGKLATCKDLASLYEVSLRRVQQVVRQYTKTGQVPVLSKNRRPKTFLTQDQKQLIDQAHAESFLSATLLRLHIQKKHHQNIPHNKIHAYLKEKGLAKPDEKKQRQRKYCRYERDHSCSLGHLDWHEGKDGIKVLPIIDDASRKILACDEFTAINTQNALKVLKDAVLHAREYNAFIRELNSDRDTTFMSNHPNALREDHAFQKALHGYGIRFIPSRKKHPQTNGKNERWFQEYDKHRHRFATLAEFIAWYNNRVHGGLNRREGLTPNEAFVQRLPSECLLGLFYQHIQKENL